MAMRCAVYLDGHLSSLAALSVELALQKSNNLIDDWIKHRLQIPATGILVRDLATLGGDLLV